MISPATRDHLVAEIEALRAHLLAALHRSVLPEWLSVELTMPQWKVLMALHAGPARTVGELAQALSVRPPTVSGILDRLETHGLVTRAGDAQDRRVVCVRLTAAGADLATRLVRMNQQRFRELLVSLDEGELKTVGDAFELLCRAAQLGAGPPVAAYAAGECSDVEEGCDGAAKRVGLVASRVGGDCL